MQFNAAVGNKLVQTFEVAVNDLSGFERGNDGRANIGITAHGGRISEGGGSLVNRGKYFLFHRYALYIRVRARECASTDQRAGPGAKILRRESAAHQLVDVLIDGRSLYIDKSSVFVLVFEDAPIRSLQ